MKNKKQLRTVVFSDKKIEYELQYKRVKNINLRIKPDCTILVSASPFVSLSSIDKFVLSKEKFITKAISKFSKKQVWLRNPKEYVSGESFYILGHELRLKVEKEKQNKVFSDGVFITLQVKDKNNFALKERLVKKYFSDQCVEVFTKVITETYPIFKKYNVAFPQLKIRNMKTRWGSCMPTKSIITLNSMLLAFPISCIEYVAMHEFCHFLHANHSKQFYNCMSIFMPDWKERKALLETINL
ncbi:MAG: M48 family metallopeptidase [Treponema sp.]|jgi:predicted metal-dependent hydrolase|nr:M48 family metallopeptidase [Treponema sp.]